ncbi:MAG: DUF1585 domain-containing protein [bacterium]|nr:DUF1585 domain-containing protein [Myxococcales bacterium]MCB9543192.1 DUF1585 domain-containing protein [Myxococcales bacterium]MCB9553655.1 DUF1585 domain-containing protein [Myxococcales bacterium]
MNRCPPWMLVVAAALCVGGAALAQTPNDALICPDESPVLDRYRYLRALSFDLRGTMPTKQEVEQLAEQPDDVDVPDEIIDAWLASDAFAGQVVRRHRDLLWNNITDQRLINDRQVIERRGQVWSVRERARTYRQTNRRGDEVFCADRPAEFGPEGEILTEPNADRIEQEGWVEVSPFWAPETTIKVCAFDAQDNEFSADGTRCNSGSGLGRRDCGCGPGLIYCAPENGRSILAAYGKSVELLIASWMTADRPYTELFETRRFFINGRIAHFYRHLAATAQLRFNPVPVDVESLPDIGWNDVDTWVEVELPSEHAGILTHPAFLLRFQTNRARASRFYDAFLCQPFQPPAGGLPPADDEESLKPDLQERAGCKYCHSLLEPAASHWGRWNEAGGGYLDPVQFPAVNPECVECATNGRSCNSFCRSYYMTRALTEDEAPYLGMLPALTFRREEHMHYVDRGPKLMMRQAVADNRFPRCTAQRTAEWLIGRDMGEADRPWLDELAYEFLQSGFSYRSLVKAIVQSERYRRVQ